MIASLTNNVLNEFWPHEDANQKSTPNSDFGCLGLLAFQINKTYFFMYSNGQIPEMVLIARTDFSLKINLTRQLLSNPFSGHKALNKGPGPTYI